MEAADWASLSDDELLERRISKLGLRLEGTTLEPLIRQLYDELSAHGLVFHPPCHIGDEWFVPIGIPAIFVPFFLVHDRLRALERTMMLEVEGGTKEWFMKLMRHEAGHAYTYAYQLTRKKKRHENRRDTDRHEPFVADVASRMKHESVRRKLVVELFDARLERRALEPQAELGDAAFEKFLVAQ